VPPSQSSNSVTSNAPIAKNFMNFLPWRNKPSKSVLFSSTYRYKGHGWAHDSSAFAICVGAQSNSAFWQLHDFFFENQTTLVPSNLEKRTMEFVDNLPGIDRTRLLECVHSGQAETQIIKDAELAQEF
jgi:hypothetical protein